MTSGSTPDRFESLRERLVDYLYDELDADGRAAIEAGMAESEDFRREVEALARTLRGSRRALSAAHEPAPARVRAAILAAASEAARKRTAALAAAASIAGTPGAWDRLLAWFRQPWAYGVVGAACALAIFVFARGKLADRQAIDEAVSGRLREYAEPPASLPTLGASTEAAEPAAAENEKASAKEAAAAQDERRAAEPLSKGKGGRGVEAGAGGEALGGLARGAPAQALKKTAAHKPEVAVDEELGLELDDVVAHGRAEAPRPEPKASASNVKPDEAPLGKLARQPLAREQTTFAEPPAGWRDKQAPAAAAAPPPPAARPEAGGGGGPAPPAPRGHRPRSLRVLPARAQRTRRAWRTARPTGLCPRSAVMSSCRAPTGCSLPSVSRRLLGSTGSFCAGIRRTRAVRAGASGWHVPSAQGERWRRSSGVPGNI